MTFDGSNDNSLSLIIGVPILATQHFEIVPYSEVVLPGVLKIPISQTSQGYCYPCEGTDARGYSAALTSVICHDSLVLIWLLNCQAIKIYINQGEQIASFQIFDTDTEYCNKVVTGWLLGCCNNGDYNEVHQVMSWFNDD